ncbi:uncharacterized protein LOC111078716 [Drosophila obscura]|uniref:uncharacterized protein LOC111078716 n=1 Tax=Drosophila obscura TaxID=7282 RepID=UPI001BB15A38|nr:uncharacterized protein LOC111078716 [Drosophila obscura]
MKYPLLLLGFLGVAHGLALYAASYPFVYSAGGSAVFTPTQQQYISQDALGQYSYGYAEPHSSKQETRTLDGTTRGTYSYRDAAGKLQTVDYLADAQGFHVAATNLPKAVIPRELVSGRSAASHGVVHPVAAHHHPVEHHGGHIVEHPSSPVGSGHSGHVEHHPVDISGRSAVHGVAGAHPEAVHHPEEQHPVEHHAVVHPSGHVVEHPSVAGTGRGAVHPEGHELPQPVGDIPEHLKHLHDEKVHIAVPAVPVPVAVARSHHVVVPAAVYGYTRPHYYSSGFYY